MKIAKEYSDEILRMSPNGDRRIERLKEIFEKEKVSTQNMATDRLAFVCMYFIPLIANLVMICLMCILILGYQFLAIVIFMVGAFVMILALLPNGTNLLKVWASKVIGFSAMKILLIFLLTILLAVNEVLFENVDNEGWIAMISIQLLFYMIILLNRNSIVSIFGSLQGDLTNPYMALNKMSRIKEFGKAPEQFLPRARIRFIRYEGITEQTGDELNIIKDRIFTGSIKRLLEKTIEFVKTQIKEYSRLGEQGIFETIKEYPDFAIDEAIVNAVAHRDYSISGTDIQIKMFDDRLVFESPGKLPGLVRLYNMRNVHFSRNPQIASVLSDYKYVKELGEGVDRMYKEMELQGLPDPEYVENNFMINLILRNTKIENFKNKLRSREVNLGGREVKPRGREVKLEMIELELNKIYMEVSTKSRMKAEKIKELIIRACGIKSMTTKELSSLFKRTEKQIKKYLKELVLEKRIAMIYPDTPNHPEQAYIKKEM